MIRGRDRLAVHECTGNAAPRGLLAALNLAVAAALSNAACPSSAHAQIVEYKGLAEASAAAPLDKQHFVVAEDECNTLLTYRVGTPTPVGSPLDLAGFLGTADKASDIEGGARVGSLIYWISSHSLTREGKAREWRHRLFAIRVDEATAPPSMVPTGTPYRHLVADMAADPKLKLLKLDKAAQIPPEETDGLNIEGLAQWKHDGLVIGFRNPLRKNDQAILVPLENPGQVIEGTPPRFGDPIFLDLGGRGIRSIDLLGDRYVIVAGPVAGEGTFALYRWSGQRSDKASPMNVTIPAGMAPEALFGIPGSDDLMVLSDDGSVNPKAACGSLDKAQQHFRALRAHPR